MAWDLLSTSSNGRYHAFVSQFQDLGWSHSTGSGHISTKTTLSYGARWLTSPSLVSHPSAMDLASPKPHESPKAVVGKEVRRKQTNRRQPTGVQASPLILPSPWETRTTCRHVLPSSSTPSIALFPGIQLSPCTLLTSWTKLLRHVGSTQFPHRLTGNSGKPYGLCPAFVLEWRS